jgi:hypothetical protein
MQFDGVALLHDCSIHANTNKAESRFVDLTMCNPKLPYSRVCGITRWDKNEVYGRNGLSGVAEGGCGIEHRGRADVGKLLCVDVGKGESLQKDPQISW